MKVSLQAWCRSNFLAVATLLLFQAAAACSDQGEPMSGATTAGAAGEAASAGKGGTGGAGGTGATGGSGGGGATGGSGGAAMTCLTEASYASFFTISATDLCAVAMYTADAKIAYQQPTWGSHGGPLLVEAGPGDGQVTLVRWAPPSGAEGKITTSNAV